MSLASDIRWQSGAVRGTLVPCPSPRSRSTAPTDARALPRDRQHRVVRRALRPCRPAERADGRAGRPAVRRRRRGGRPRVVRRHLRRTPDAARAARRRRRRPGADGRPHVGRRPPGPPAPRGAHRDAAPPRRADPPRGRRDLRTARERGRDLRPARVGRVDPDVLALPRPRHEADVTGPRRGGRAPHDPVRERHRRRDRRAPGRVRGAAWRRGCPGWSWVPSRTTPASPTTSGSPRSSATRSRCASSSPSATAWTSASPRSAGSTSGSRATRPGSSRSSR